MDALHFLAGAVAATLIWLALARFGHRDVARGLRVLPTLAPGRKVAFRDDLDGDLAWYVVTTIQNYYGEVTVELIDQATFERYGRKGVF